MDAYELEQLARHVRKLKAETQYIELKAARSGCPMHLYDTLSAFANQNEGGCIIFGIDERDDFKITGVYDPQDLQQKVAEQCKTLEPNVRATFTLAEIDGKVVVAAEISPAEASDKPVFYKPKGRIGGSYIRVGDADEPMSEREIYGYEVNRKGARDDIRIVLDAGIGALDKEKTDSYLKTVKRNKVNLASNLPDSEILRLLGVTKDGSPTIAGLLVFSDFPQQYFPMLCIKAFAVRGTGLDSGENGERFLSSKRIEGPVQEMLEQAVDFVESNSRRRVVVGPSDAKRHDECEYPVVAVREAVLNALMHRDYSVISETVPINLAVYKDRLEITNPGGLLGNMTVSQLGKQIPRTRNPVLTRLLEEAGLAENRYSGIPTMLNACKKAGLPDPAFYSQHGDFKVVIRNQIEHVVTDADKETIIDALLDYCSVPRSRDELTAFTGKSRYYTMSEYVRPLLDDGKLRMTLPDKPKSSRQRYVKA